ncbi:hypothetical protein DFH09DRAFT_228765 [Mycena vulgaris]|nr:hypothetical protein DFH09DRAFT_228765 [Mycena vulgaris]
MDKTTAAVVGSSVISFAAGISQQMREDVMSSTLLAQIVAGTRFNRMTEASQWYAEYFDTLGLFGWRTRPYSRDKFPEAQQLPSVDAAIVAFSNRMTAHELELVQESIAAMKLNPGATKLFNEESYQASIADFQFIVCSHTTRASICYFQYRTETPMQDAVLWGDFGGTGVDFFAGAQDMLLDQEEYAAVREHVIQQVRASSRKKIVEI